MKKMLIVLFVFMTFALSAEESPYFIKPEVDYPLIGTSLLIGIMPQIFAKEVSTKSLRTDYNRNNVNSLDRLTLNQDNRTFDDIGNITPYATSLLAYLGLAKKDMEAQGKAVAYEDFILLTEALSITGGLGQICRHSFKRPRPYVYNNNPNDHRRNSEDELSFFSGHTASAFSSAVLFDEVYKKRYPNDNHTLMSASLYGLATLTGVGRVMAGDHFITDILVGAAVGYSVGKMVPYLHLKNPDGLSARVYPSLSREHASLNLMVNY